MHCETWETLYALSDGVLLVKIIFVLMVTVAGLLIRTHNGGPFEMRLFGHLLIATTDNKTPQVLRVSLPPVHEFRKDPVESIKLIEGLGVEGDAHYGKTVQHLSRVRQDPSQPNLRQVHLIQGEILEDLGLQPCDIGENLTTQKVLTCSDLEEALSCILGLKEKFIMRDETRNIVGRKAGVMGVVTNGGEIRKGMKITVEEPKKFEGMECV